MSYKELVDLAYEAALRHWGYYHDRAKEYPNSVIFKHREDKAWKTLNDVERILCELEASERQTPA